MFGGCDPANGDWDNRVSYYWLNPRAPLVVVLPIWIDSRMWSLLGKPF